MSVSIAGLDKAELLAALYERAQPMGMGFFHYVPGPMCLDEARGLLRGGGYFDYVKGRPLKIDIAGDYLDTRLYNRDAGSGAAERVIEALRARSAPPAQA